MPKKTTKTTKAAKKKNITEEVNKLVEADAASLPGDGTDIESEPSLAEQVRKVAEAEAAHPEDAITEDTCTDITLAKFKKLFKEEIKETADWLWREDKEGDYKDKKTVKEAALSFVIGNHDEYHVTDRY